MEKNTFAFVAVCLVIYLGYSQYLNNKYPDRFKIEPSLSEQVANLKSDTLSPPSSPMSEDTRIEAKAHRQSEVKLLTDNELTIENEDVIYWFDQTSGGLKNVILKNYKEDDGLQDKAIVDRHLAIQALVGGNQISSGEPFQAKRYGNTISFERAEGQWRLKHEISIPEKGYGADVHFLWQNLSPHTQQLDAIVAIQKDVPFAKKTGGFLPGLPTEKPMAIASLSGSVERNDIQNYCEDRSNYSPILTEANKDISYLGVDNHYFLMAFLPQQARQALEISKSSSANLRERCAMNFYFRMNHGRVEAGQSVEQNYKAWFGPKYDKYLEAYDKRLSDAVDFGFFSSVAQILLGSLRWVFNIVGNWGLAIIIFTIFIKFLFYPLTRASIVSMKKMQKLQPEMNRIKEKHKDDPRLQQQEIMRFMSQHKVNPAKGCLPMLAQAPVFFAFYRVLSSSIELRQAPFYGWIHDLSISDPYYITPVLMGTFMILQQKLTPTSGMDKTQERIMMMLPIFFSVMMISLPAGLVLYMLTNSLVSIGQQQWLNRRLS